MKLNILLLLGALLTGCTSCEDSESTKEREASKLMQEEVFCKTEQGCASNEFYCLTKSGRRVYCPSDKWLDCFPLDTPIWQVDAGSPTDGGLAEAQ